MSKRINQLVEECGVGEFSDSTVKAFIKSTLYKFGEECFTAGVKLGAESEFNGGFHPLVFEKYLKSLENEYV